MTSFAEKVETEIWIDRNGKIHKWVDGDDPDIVSLHHEIAHKMFPKLEYPVEYLMKLGWVRVSSIGGFISSKEPTQSQINALFDRYGIFVTVEII